MSLQEYREFIAGRSVAQVKSGFKPERLRDVLKVHQRAVVDFSLERGKSAAFLDCVSGDTVIETIAGPRRIDDLCDEGKPFIVKSVSKGNRVQWSLATAPFKKGVGSMKKVTFSDGASIKVTDGHQFKTPTGWVSCADAYVGLQVVSQLSQRQTNLDTFQQELPQDALHYLQKLEGLTDDCSRYHRLYDLQLHRAEGIAEAFAPLLDDALALDGLSLHMDGQGHTSGYTPSRQTFGHPSTPGSVTPDMNQRDALESLPHSFGSELSVLKHYTSPQFLRVDTPPQSWREHLQCQFQSFLAVPCYTSLSVSCIVSIEQYGEEVKYDMHVPGDQCYIGNGVVCHNTGLGKSLIELEWADQVAQETGKPVLILCPLAVAGQMVREGQKFGIDARQVRSASEVGTGVNVANYERLHLLDPSQFGGVALDESSILKSFQSKTRAMLAAAFCNTKYRLAATATPSPNDHMELGNHAEFLGVMRQQEMLSKWFINDTSTASKEWRLKGHARDDFWQWVASWSRCATLPSDLGGDDTGYSLPEVIRSLHIVDADKSIDTNGMLFRIPELSATSFHDEKRKTLDLRCNKAADLANSHNNPVTVWCESNEESKTLARMVNGAVELRGDQSPEEKERIILAFIDGDIRALVTKPKLAGFGLNFQHCAHAVFASISYSYEQHYQAVRRSHRFGQMQQVVNDIVVSDTEMQIWDVINDKAQKHGEMKVAMADAMKKAQSQTKRMVAYDRPFDLWFPEWVKSEGVIA